MRVLFALLALAVTVSAQGLTGPNFYITGGDGTDYTFSIDGAPVKDPTLSLTVGTTYKFILNSTLPNHPFGFSIDNNAATITMSNLTSAAQGGVTSSGSCASGNDNNPLAWITTNTTNPCILSITPPAAIAGSSIYYRCSIHANMVGTLTAVAAGGGVTTTPPTGGATTPVPTTTAPPTGSSTGKNGAACIVPGAAALVIAAINALFSA